MCCGSAPAVLWTNMHFKTEWMQGINKIAFWAESLCLAHFVSIHGVPDQREDWCLHLQQSNSFLSTPFGSDSVTQTSSSCQSCKTHFQQEYFHSAKHDWWGVYSPNLTTTTTPLSISLTFSFFSLFSFSFVPCCCCFPRCVTDLSDCENFPF